MNVRLWILRAARLPVLLACGLAVSTSLADPSPPSGDELMARLSGVENVSHPYSWLVTGGQPDADALAALAAAGIRDVYDMRAADEPRGFNERAAAKALGLRYLAIPTRAGDFNDGKFTAIRHHLVAHGPKRPMFIHCASGNRVGAALLPWLVLDQGLSDDLALEMARTMGLRDGEPAQRAWDYIRSHEPPRR